MSFFSWIANLFSRPVKVEPLPRVNPSKPDPVKPVTIPNQSTPIQSKPIQIGKLKGFDVSHHNGGIPWQKFKDEGYTFCLIKASDGKGLWTDPMYKKNFEMAKKFGFLVTAYHFFRPNVDPQAQFSLFKKVVGDFSQLDFVPAVDWEVHEGIASDVQLARFQVMIGLVEKEVKAYPIAYIPQWFIEELNIKLPPSLAKYALWLSWYSSRPVPMINPWGRCTILQWIGDKYIPEFGGEFDLNTFNGTVEDLKKLGRVS